MQVRNEDTLAGFVCALGAYLLWGIMPIYLKAIDHIPPAEIILHRVLWSLPIAGAFLLVTGRTGDLRRALASPRMLGMAAMTALLVSVNWGIYVWAITNERALDAALGYFINPLFSIFLGAILLKEPLDTAQRLAVALAAAAVAVLTWQAGQLPLVAIGLTLSWGGYAYFKKQLPVGANQGFFLEVLLLSPPALAYLAYLGSRGESHFLAGSPADTWLLLAAGLVTAVPLLLYANGAKGLRLSTIGIMQYTTPTMVLLLALFAFGEEFGPGRRIAFPMIWAALAIYTGSILHRARRTRRQTVPPPKVL